MRARSGKVSHVKRLKIRRATKGMIKSRRSSYRLGKQAVVKSMQYAYRDRRNRKRDFRRLWAVRINAAARLNQTTYRQLIAGLKRHDMIINRKILAELALNEPVAFSALIKSAIKQ